MLWYWNDWQGGTVTMSRHLKGCYIDLLHAQFNNGHLSIEEINTVLGPDSSAWQTLQKKFECDEKGLFFNKRLEEEQIKRSNFTKSRRKNLESNPHTLPHMQPHMERHMENENENRIVIEDRKGVQGETIEEKLASAFNEIYLDPMRLKAPRLYPGVKFDLELERFKQKVIGSPRVYQDHDAEGLRLAFGHQLRSATPTAEMKPTRAKLI